MLKALLKKQLAQLCMIYLVDKKGKRRSTKSMVGMIALMSLAFLSVAAAFAGLAELMASGLIAAHMDWLYFSVIGMMAIFVGMIGSVISTYSALFHAKDNELLLSMPIPPRVILFSRMTEVYLMGFLFSLFVLIPTIIVYWVRAGVTVLTVVFPILLIFVIGFFILGLSCVFGWIIALIGSRVRMKSLVTVLVSFALLLLYYFVYFRMQSMITQLVANAEKVGSTVKTFLFPFYHLGLAFLGKPVSFLIFLGITAVLFVIVYAVLSATFLKIATTDIGTVRTVYKERKTERKSALSALIAREIRHYGQSPIYMMNTGLGLLFLLAGTVVVFVKRSMLLGVLGMAEPVFPQITALLPVFLAAAVSLIMSMNNVSAPSVSLEGNTYWIVRSMPVETKKVLMSKLCLHLILNLAPTVICTVLIGIALGIDGIGIVCAALLTGLYVCFCAAFGLTMNLLNPNLEWTSETVPVKQGMSVLYAMLAGMVGALVIGGGGFLLNDLLPVVPVFVWLLLFSALLAGGTYLLTRWIFSRGVEIFEDL